MNDGFQSIGKDGGGPGDEIGSGFSDEHEDADGHGQPSGASTIREVIVAQFRMTQFRSHSVSIVVGGI